MANQTVKYSDIHRATPEVDRHDPKPHTHDNRYYQKSEVDTQQATKQAKAIVTVGQTDGDYPVSAYTATDSKSAFQLALEAAFGVSNHILILAASDPYTLLSTHLLASGQILEGVNRSGVVLQMTAGRNQTVLSNANASSGGLTTDVQISNLTIDQQGAYQTAGGGIVVTGIQGWHIENVTIRKSHRFNFLCLHQSTGVANLAGTITITNASEVVSGSGTTFTTQLAVGDIIKTSGGAFGRVAAITSDTELILTRAWGYATATGVTFKRIEPNSGCYFKNVEFQGTINDADASGYGFFDNGILEDCVAHHAAGGGCGFVPDHTRGLRILNCRAYANTNSGFSLETCEEVVTVGGSAYNNVNGNGYQLISGSTRCQVIGMDCYRNGGNGFCSSYNISTAPYPDENAFIDCLAHHNAGYGVRFDGAQRNVAQSCRVWNNNTGGMVANTSNGRLPSLNRFRFCFVYDDRTTKLQARGIYILTGDQNVVEFCTSRDADHLTAGYTNTGTNTVLVTLENSSLGINTNSPTSRVQVNTPATADSAAQFMSYAATPTSKPFVLQANALQSANLLEMQSSAGNIFTAITAGGLFRGPIANASAPTYSFQSDGGTGMYRPSGSANTIRFTTAATDRVQINTTDITTTLPLTIGGALATALSTKTGNYTITAADSIILADATAGARTMTLPTAVGIPGRQYTIKRINAGANTVTVATTSPQTIDGSSTYSLTSQYQKVTIVSDGTNWMIL